MSLTEIERDTYFDRMPIGRIAPDPINPRKHAAGTLDDDFVNSIRPADGTTHARIVEPIVVRPDPACPPLMDGLDGQFLIIAGERRYLAALATDAKTVPCRVIYDLTDADVLEMMLVENGQRLSLTALEEANAYRALIDMGRSQRSIESIVGRSQGTVSKRLTLLKLPERAQQLLNHGTISTKTALALVGLIRHGDRFGKLLDFATGPEVDDRDIAQRVDRELRQIAHEKDLKKNPPAALVLKTEEKPLPIAANGADLGEPYPGGMTRDPDDIENNETRALQLPRDVAFEPTRSLADGESGVTQCANCGLVACVPDCHGKPQLGACPSCGGEQWWRQTIPVSLFTTIEREEVYFKALEYCAASAALRNADGPTVTQYVGERDLAHHDLMVAAGYGCDCDEGTCPAGPARAVEPTDDIATIGDTDVEVDAQETERDAVPAPTLNTQEREEASTVDQPEGTATSTATLVEPWNGYRGHTARMAVNIIRNKPWTADALQAIVDYEQAHDQRSEVIDAATTKLAEIEQADV